MLAKNLTIIPFVPMLLFYKFIYFRDSEPCRELLIFSALFSPNEFPCKFKLSSTEQFSRHLMNISIPTSVISLKEKSICLMIYGKGESYSLVSVECACEEDDIPVSQPFGEVEFIISAINDVKVE